MANHLRRLKIIKDLKERNKTPPPQPVKRKVKKVTYNLQPVAKLRDSEFSSKFVEVNISS